MSRMHTWSPLAGRLPKSVQFRALPPRISWIDLNLGTDRYLVVPITINGARRPAVIDSGATRSIIRHDVALALNLAYRGPTQARTVTRTISGASYDIAHLAIGDCEFDDIEVASYDLGDMEALASRPMPFIIGQDLLHKFDFEVDFPAGKLRFLRDYRSDDASGGAELHLQSEPAGLSTLAIALEGRPCGNAIVDLGNDVPISMSAEFARQAGLLDDRRISTALNAGVGGVSIDHVFSIRDAQLGPYTLNEIPATAIEDWKLSKPLSLGWPFLAAFTATFSFGRNRLRLTGDDRLTGAPFPKDRCGIGAQRWPDHMVIRHVAIDSPAWRSGLRENDRIVAIDGKSIDAVYPPRDMRFGMQDVGTKIALELSDGRQLVMILEDYF